MTMYYPNMLSAGERLKWYAVLEILFTLPGIPQHMRRVLPSCRIQVHLYMAYPGIEI